MDLDRSQGSWLFDARRGRDVLDFFTNFASCPIGYNHPRSTTPSSATRIAQAAINKPANSRHLHRPTWRSSSRRSRASPSRRSPQAHVLHRRRRPRHRERAEDGVRLEDPQEPARRATASSGTQIMHLREAFHGRTGYTLSLTNTPIRARRSTSRSSTGRASTIRSCASRHRRRCSRRQRPSRGALDAGEAVPRRAKGRHRRVHHGADPGRGRRQPLPSRVLPRPAPALRRERHAAHLRRGAVGRRPHRQDVGVRSTTASSPTSSASARRRRSAASPRTTASSTSTTTSSRSRSRINSTWGGNLSDMVRSQRYFEIIDEEDLVDNARLGERLHAGLQGLAEVFPGMVTNVRGRGLFTAFDLPSTELRDAALKAMGEQDLLALACGDVTVRCRPPLVINAAEIDEALRRMERAIATAEAARSAARRRALRLRPASRRGVPQHAPPPHSPRRSPRPLTLPSGVVILAGQALASDAQPLVQSGRGGLFRRALRAAHGTFSTAFSAAAAESFAGPVSDRREAPRSRAGRRPATWSAGGSPARAHAPRGGRPHLDDGERRRPGQAAEGVERHGRRRPLVGGDPQPAEAPALRQRRRHPGERLAKAGIDARPAVGLGQGGGQEGPACVASRRRRAAADRSAARDRRAAPPPGRWDAPSPAGRARPRRVGRWRRRAGGTRWTGRPPRPPPSRRRAATPPRPARPRRPTRARERGRPHRSRRASRSKAP